MPTWRLVKGLKCPYCGSPHIRAFGDLAQCSWDDSPRPKATRFIVGCGHLGPKSEFNPSDLMSYFLHGKNGTGGTGKLI